MLIWQTPVLDRTSSDVSKVLELLEKKWVNFSSDEKTEWLNGMKGSINTSDYERIQNNIQLLSDVLELGLTVSEVPDVPQNSFYNEMISNTNSIRDAYVVHSTTPDVPSMPLNTYTKWNDLEQNLNDIYEILLNNFHYYCGSEIYAGDETGLLL